MAQNVRDNRLPLHYRHLARRRHRIVIPVTTQMSLPPVCLNPLFKLVQRLAILSQRLGCKLRKGKSAQRRTSAQMSMTMLGHKNIGWFSLPINRDCPRLGRLGLRQPLDPPLPIKQPNIFCDWTNLGEQSDWRQYLKKKREALDNIAITIGWPTKAVSPSSAVSTSSVCSQQQRTLNQGAPIQDIAFLRRSLSRLNIGCHPNLLFLASSEEGKHLPCDWPRPTQRLLGPSCPKPRKSPERVTPGQGPQSP